VLQPNAHKVRQRGIAQWRWWGSDKRARTAVHVELIERHAIGRTNRTARPTNANPILLAHGQVFLIRGRRSLVDIFFKDGGNHFAVFFIERGVAKGLSRPRRRG
jgi:hypothetical protein